MPNTVATGNRSSCHAETDRKACPEADSPRKRKGRPKATFLRNVECLGFDSLDRLPGVFEPIYVFTKRPTGPNAFDFAALDHPAAVHFDG